MFYQTVVSSCLFYAVVCWGGSIKKRDKMRLDKLVRRAGSVVGVELLDSVVKVEERRTLHKLLSIMDDDGHPLRTIIMDRRSKFSELAPSSHQKLKSTLKEKCLNEIYTELYITEGGCGEVSNEHENCAEGKANQDVLFIFPLPVRELNLMKEKLSLEALLHQFFKDTKKLKPRDYHHYRVMFIFDGLDEYRLPLDFQNNESLLDRDVRMLFIDYSSAFNTVIPAKLIPKLTDLGLYSHLSNWILDFLTDDCRCQTHIQLADNTTILGLIADGDKTAYRDEVSTLSEWCSDNHLCLTSAKPVLRAMLAVRFTPATARQSFCRSLEVILRWGNNATEPYSWFTELTCDSLKKQPWHFQLDTDTVSTRTRSPECSEVPAMHEAWQSPLNLGSTRSRCLLLF
ncbi:hypothetical protein NFI96_030779, partial [Prochilodus magdalenae]